MDERRKWKNSKHRNAKKNYCKLNIRIKRECNKAKKAYWAEQCEEIEKLHRMNHSDKVYEKVKMLSGGMKMSSKNNAIKDGNDELIRNDAR